MIRRQLTGPGGHLLAIAVVAGLGVLNWHLLTAEIDTSPLPPKDAGAEGTVAAIRAVGEDPAKAAPASYPQTLARPLFRSSRRPPEKDKPQTAARPSAPARQVASLPEDLTLIGIMKGAGRGGRALIRFGGAPNGEWVEVGHVLQGWRLSRIDAAGIAFEAEGREQRLSLFPPPNQ